MAQSKKRLAMALSSLAIPAAISVGSSIAGSLFSDEPDVPDLSSAVKDQTTRARRNFSEKSENARNRLEENIAATNAAGAVASGQREEMFDAQSSGRAELENRASEILSDAVQRERIMKFRRDQQQAQNRAQGIASIGQNLANLAFQGGVGSDLFSGGGSPAPTDATIAAEEQQLRDTFGEQFGNNRLTVPAPDLDF